jgi:hypothetical protein
MAACKQLRVGEQIEIALHLGCRAWTKKSENAEATLCQRDPFSASYLGLRKDACTLGRASTFFPISWPLWPTIEQGHKHVTITSAVPTRRFDTSMHARHEGPELPVQDPAIPADPSERAGSQSAGIHPSAAIQQRSGKERQDTVTPPAVRHAAESNSGCEVRDLRNNSFSDERRVLSA